MIYESTTFLPLFELPATCSFSRIHANSSSISLNNWLPRSDSANLSFRVFSGLRNASYLHNSYDSPKKKSLHLFALIQNIFCINKGAYAKKYNNFILYQPQY